MKRAKRDLENRNLYILVVYIMYTNNMTMRISEETKEKLEGVKRVYELRSLEGTVNFMLDRTGMEASAKLEFVPKVWKLPYEFLPEVDWNDFIASHEVFKDVVFTTTNVEDLLNDDTLPPVPSRRHWLEIMMKNSLGAVVHKLIKLNKHGLYDPLRYIFYLARAVDEGGERHLVAYGIPT